MQKLRRMLLGAIIGGITSALAPALFGQATVHATLSDQKSVAITIYNSNLAFVRDVRQVTLPAGDVRLTLHGVSAKINPASVYLRSTQGEGDPTLIEQRFRYDLLTPDALLRRYVGKELTLVESRKENGTTRDVTIPAKLLSDNSGPVWQIGPSVVTGIENVQYVFPKLPDGFESRPTLVWLLHNPHEGGKTLAFSYLTGGLSWSADYVLTLARGTKTADLSAWVSLKNETGTTFDHAALQLVAGSVHQTGWPQPRMFMPTAALGSVGGLAAPAQFSQLAFSEYHLYTLHRRTTLRDQESKQISLFAASDIPITKTYEVSGQTYYYASPLNNRQTMRDPVQVHIKFKNDKAHSLGIPMPAGTIRAEQADAQAGMEFVGEDHLPNTAAGEKVDLVIGNAFDIAEERKQTSFERLGQHETESSYEITLRNYKPRPVTVEVNEPLSGDWTITQSSLPYKKISTYMARFLAPVEANGKTVLTYQVRIVWPR